jgi:transposase-like protein
MGRQYNEEFKKQIVAASYSEGVSVASVARRFEVNDSAIYYWRKRYGHPIDESETSVDASSAFIPITVCDEEKPLSAVETAPTQQTLDTWQVTISMGLDRHVKIDGAFDLPSLIKLVRGVAA